MPTDDMTIGEIGRALARLESSQARQTNMLDEIKIQTTKTNGSVIRLEQRVNALDQEVGQIKRRRAHQHTLQRQEDRPDATTFTVPNNILKALGIIIGSGAVAAIAAWFGFKMPQP